MAKAKSFDPADYLDSPEMIAAYLTEALESDDAAEIARDQEDCGSFSRAWSACEIVTGAVVCRQERIPAIAFHGFQKAALPCAAPFDR